MAKQGTETEGKAKAEDAKPQEASVEQMLSARIAADETNAQKEINEALKRNRCTFLCPVEFAVDGNGIVRARGRVVINSNLRGGLNGKQ